MRYRERTLNSLPSPIIHRVQESATADGHSSYINVWDLSYFRETSDDGGGKPRRGTERVKEADNESNRVSECMQLRVLRRPRPLLPPKRSEYEMSTKGFHLLLHFFFLDRSLLRCMMKIGGLSFMYTRAYGRYRPVATPAGSPARPLLMAGK